jgi:ABC-2 type transport system ATP-binding protein
VGTIDVAGRDPFRQRKENAATIGVIFGQRSSLWWDIRHASPSPAQGIYRIPEETTGRTSRSSRSC